MADVFLPQDVNKVMRDKIIACGGVPVIDDLLRTDAFNLLFAQLLSLLACAGGPVGTEGAMFAVYNGPAGPVDITISSFVYNPVPSNWALLPTLNPLVTPYPPATIPLAGGPAPSLLNGPAPAGGDVFVLPANVPVASFIAGADPNNWNVLFTLSDGTPSFLIFTWKGLKGVIIINPAIVPVP